MTLEKALAELEKPRQERDTVQAVAQKWQQHEGSQKSELQLAQEKLAAAQQELGTTSAHAENTQGFACLSPAAGNYLRVRGEYPPAGQTWFLGNYLRMRGEYSAEPSEFRTPWELPPYARRILPGCILTVKHHGTTSVCAENTGGGFFHSFFLGNYLRMRGECHKYSHGALRLGELPPHARRILFSAYRSHLEKGTTSAYAENTPFHTIGIRVTRNYLRVRGEYISPLDSTGIFGELPPRARRIPVFPNHLASSLGTTSACAENTTANTIKPTQRRNYLRVRGEYAA